MALIHFVKLGGLSMKTKCFKYSFVLIILDILFLFRLSFAFEVSFIDVPVRAVVLEVSKLSKQNYVYNGGDLRMTWVQKDLNRESFSDEFSRALNVYDLQAIKKDKFISIRPVHHIPSKDSLVVIRPDWLSARSVVDGLKEIYSETDTIKISGGENEIVISGAVDDVSFIAETIRKSDSPTYSEIIRLPIKNIPLKQMKEILVSFVELQKYCIPDYWTRSIIYKGRSENLIILKNLISVVDVPQLDKYSEEVVYLNTVLAESVVPIVEQAYSDINIKIVSPSKIVLFGDSGNVASAKEFIGKFDGAGVQVKVDCIIASLSDTSFKELGMRLGYVGDNYSLDINESLSTFFDPTILLSYVADIYQIDVSAVDNVSKGEIISQPQLTVMNGQSAEILVGQNIPIVTSRKQRENVGDYDAVEVERVDIGVKLIIKPEVQGDFIKLKVYQEISSISNEEQGVDVTTDKKMIDSTVLVADGQTIILGGVKSVEESEYKEKIPLLGDIPFIGGFLFSYKTNKGVNRNLVISIRPQIMRPVKGV